MGCRESRRTTCVRATFEQACFSAYRGHSELRLNGCHDQRLFMRSAISHLHTAFSASRGPFTLAAVRSESDSREKCVGRRLAVAPPHATCVPLDEPVTYSRHVSPAHKIPTASSPSPLLPTRHALRMTIQYTYSTRALRLMIGAAYFVGFARVCRQFEPRATRSL